MNCQTHIAIYARVASNQQADQGTIDSQIAVVQKFAEENRLKVDPDLIFADKGVSGSTLARPQLDALRDKAAEGEIDQVLVLSPDRLSRNSIQVLSPDRLSRNSIHQFVLLEEFDRLGIEISFVNRTITTSTEEQLLLQVSTIIQSKPAPKSHRGNNSK